MKSLPKPPNSKLTTAMSWRFFAKFSSERVERRKEIWALTMVKRDEDDVDEGLWAPPASPGGKPPALLPLMDEVDRCPPGPRLMLLLLLLPDGSPGSPPTPPSPGGGLVMLPDMAAWGRGRGVWSYLVAGLFYVVSLYLRRVCRGCWVYEWLPLVSWLGTLLCLAGWWWVMKKRDIGREDSCKSPELLEEWVVEVVQSLGTHEGVRACCLLPKT